MYLSSDSFHDGGTIPGEFAFAVPDPSAHMTFSANRNPHLSWSGAPRNTQSFALICYDPDVPLDHTDIDRDGHELPTTLPRTEFFHWLLYDIPKTVSEIRAGQGPGRIAQAGHDHDMDGRE